MLRLTHFSPSLFYIKHYYKAFILSTVALFLSTFLSSPLFFLTKLDVKESLLTGEIFSYCYEVSR